MIKRRDVEKMVGVTRRTLQEYDKIGLLSPTMKTENGGYWFYDDDAIKNLMQIQIFIEAGYKRKPIKQILELEDSDLLKEYKLLIEKLKEKRKRIDGMINYIETIVSVTSMPTEAQNAFAKLDPSSLYSETSFSTALDESIEQFAEVNVKEEGPSMLLFTLLPIIGTYRHKLAYDSHEIQGFVKGMFEYAIQIMKEDDDFSMDKLDAEQAMEADFGKLLEEILKHEEFIKSIDKQFGEGTVTYISNAVNTYIGNNSTMV